MLRVGVMELGAPVVGVVDGGGSTGRALERGFLDLRLVSQLDGFWGGGTFCASLGLGDVAYSRMVSGGLFDVRSDLLGHDRVQSFLADLASCVKSEVLLDSTEDLVYRLSVWGLDIASEVVKAVHLLEEVVDVSEDSVGVHKLGEAFFEGRKI